MAKPPALPTVHDAVSCLRKLTEIFRQRRQELATSVGLTVQQWAVLDEIESEHFMPSMFARQRESSAAAVSKILRQLQDKGLVVASLSTSDGRQRNYELTKSGKQTLSLLRRKRQHAIDDVWCRFDESDLLGFTRFASELIAELERHSRENAAAKDHSSPPRAAKASPKARKGTEKNGESPLRQGV